MLVLLMAVFMLFGLAPGAAWADITGSTDDGTVSWVFTDDGTLTFSGSGEITSTWNKNIDKFSVKNIVINEGIASIGDHAFENCLNLASINIAESVKTIRGWSFHYCSSLTNIDIPNSVTNIENFAFYGCLGLTSITIPDSMTSISRGVFSGCSSLTNISIPDSIINIDNYTFEECNSLINISVDSNNPKYMSENGVLFNKDKTVLESYPAGKKAENYVIPDSVIGITAGAFSGCTNLTGISIQNSVIDIGNSAFYNCNSLTSINIPETVANIGAGAFSGCSSLTNINIPNRITSIGTTVFSSCTSLITITIPENVTSIGSGAFKECSSLNDINVDLNNPKYMSENGVLFSKDKTILEAYPAGKKADNYVVPEGVNIIEYGAFFGCSSLKNISIPDSVASIEYSAFYNCDSLTSIDIPNSVTSIKNHVFSGCSNLTSITIPNKVEEIGFEAFINCSNLTDVYYDGLQAEWENITIDEYNEDLTNATIHFSDGTVLNPGSAIINVPDAVKYLPYALAIQLDDSNGEWNNATFSITKGSLPRGVELKANGEVYGVPTETGEFKLTVTVQNDNGTKTSSQNILLKVLENTDENVAKFTDTKDGYGIEKRVEDKYVSQITDQEFICEGAYAQFVDFWLDGNKLVDGLDYDSEEGSTKINIRAATFEKYSSVGTHTIVAEFHKSNGSNYVEFNLKRTAQNYRILEDKPDDSYDKTIFKTNILPGAVKYVPYQFNLNDLAQDGVYLFDIKCENLPAGWETDVYTVGEDTTPIYYIKGMPTEAGNYTIKMTAFVSESNTWGRTAGNSEINVPSNVGGAGGGGSSNIKEITLRLNVSENSDDNVKNTSDEGYELIQPLPETIIHYTYDINQWEDLTFISNGPFDEFMECWVDGKKLTKDVDYIAEAGSTKITVRAQTLRNVGVGKHTIVAEFRVGGDPGGELKRAVQNYELRVITSSGGGSHRGGNRKPVEPEKPVEPVKPEEPIQPIEQPTEPQMDFVDVPEDAWFYNEVLWVYTEKLMQGNGDGTFGPNQPTSPAALVTVLARLAKADLTTYAGYTYEDIKEGMWYTDSAKWAKGNGLLGESVFDADSAISRGNIAQILLKYLQALGVELPVVEQEHAFADAELLTAEENAAFQALYALGIFQGNGDNTINPQGATTRAELAALLHRVSNALTLAEQIEK